MGGRGVAEDHAPRQSVVNQRDTGRPFRHRDVQGLITLAPQPSLRIHSRNLPAAGGQSCRVVVENFLAAGFDRVLADARVVVVDPAGARETGHIAHAEAANRRLGLDPRDTGGDARGNGWARRAALTNDHELLIAPNRRLKIHDGHGHRQAQDGDTPHTKKTKQQAKKQPAAGVQRVTF